jgi:TPP-dependent pyruvate/acetoin dehydrogenase alpha subunit
MKHLLTTKELIDFEDDIAGSFNSGLIKAPIHLYSGNENQIIDIFKNVNEEDWVFCSWRSHYQCLLKGVPREILKQDIINGKSITLCYPDFNIYSSAIVTGNIPIATGTAFDIKRKGKRNHVWCFVGDMTSETGTFYENHKYAVNHDLPITYIIEDNGKSVCTDTREVWNINELTYSKNDVQKIIYYKYETKYPHAGSGKRIQF